MRRIAILTALILAVSFSALAQPNDSADNETAGNLTYNNTTALQDTGASNISTVMLTSTLNYPDTVISSSPSERTGIPVLLTESNNLSEETRDTIENLDVEKAYVIGGPAVISEEVESEVDSITENSTTRLWGETQVETSTEVSEFFWMENSEATVVQQPVDSEEGYKLLTSLKSAITEDEEPLLISEPGNLSEETVRELERLDVDQVDVYSTNTSNASNVSQQLEDLGADSNINEGSVSELREQIREETVTNDTENVTVVAASNFTYSLNGANIREPTVLVTGQNEIETAVEALNSTQDENITVLGEPGLSQQVADAIENSTNISAELRAERPVQTVAEMLGENREVWSMIQRERLPEWISETDSPQIDEIAENAVEEAEETINGSSNVSEEVQNLVEEARKELEEENYFRARNLAITAHSEARLEAFLRDDEGPDGAGENRTEAENETGEMLNAGDSRINLSASNSSINASMSYVASNTGYSVDSYTEGRDSEISFTFNVTSSDEVSGQALTEVTGEDSIKNLDTGNYTVNVEIVVDGETVNELNETVEVVG
ncbi:hypothetical protein AQV86_01775 [Nanohaloarchaea archaeon SG9]|nr:hypothetical protein AQV86_01775 [Nanohaloarchaea archaeon SG9]